MGTLGAQLSTIAGIGTATGLAVKIVRRSGRNVKWMRELPVWVIASAVAIVFTVVARYSLHSIEGDVADLIYQSVINAATGSGFYGWLNDPGQTLHDADGDGIPDNEQQSAVVDDGTVELQ